MTRTLTEQEIQEFRDNGVVYVKAAIDLSWVERLSQVVETQMNQPGKWVNDANPGKTTDRMFTDRYMWQHNSEIKDFIYQSGCAEMAAQAMQSKQIRFYFDHILVKEPGTAEQTPWHQDIPYWPFLGKQVCSCWVALTPSTVKGSSMEFVRGSHLANTYYKAEVFGKREDHPNNDWTGKSQGVPVPDIDAKREDFDIVGWDVEPGDALIFSAWTLHGAPGNQSDTQRRAAISTRWLGDDAIWHPHAAADPIVTQDDVSVKAGDTPKDDAVFPRIVG